MTKQRRAVPVLGSLMLWLSLTGCAGSGWISTEVTVLIGGALGGMAIVTAQRSADGTTSTPLSIKPLPGTAVPEAVVEIYVARNYNFINSFPSVELYFDDNLIAEMYTKQYTQFLAPEGPHRLSLQYGGYFCFYCWAWQTLELKRDNSRYFLVSPSLSLGMEIEEIPESEWFERVPRYGFVPPGSKLPNGL